VWINDPLVPVTVIVYVPVLVLLPTFIVRVEVPEVEIEVGFRVAVNPDGAVAARETVPANPLRAVTFIVEVPEDPLLMLKDAGDAEIEKSGMVTCTDTLIVCINDPLAPVTVTEYDPLLALLGTVIVSVDVPDVVRDVGLGVAVHPLGAVAESETMPVNPLTADTVIVEIPEAPFLMFRDVGAADSEKSGVVDGVKIVVTGLPKPVTRS